MQFNKELIKNYSVNSSKKGSERILEFEIRQKSVDISELNQHIVKFVQENKINEVDGNSMQLITEELVVMVLAPKITDGIPLQYFISYNRREAVITIGIGYPGESYNPFDDEDDIFMINVFREWISDIKFNNLDNSFNELVLTIQGEKSDTAFIEEEEEADPKEIPINSKKTFDFHGTDADKYLKPSEGVLHNIIRGDGFSLELLIRDGAINIQKLNQLLDIFMKEPDLNKKTMQLDSAKVSAESAIKSVSAVLLSDVLKYILDKFPYTAYKVNYVKEDREIVLRIRYPGVSYNPFVDNSEGKGIKAINRQPSIIPFYTYKADIKMNEVLLLMTVD